MVVNNEILTALIHCNYKAYLKGQNFQSSKSDFEIVINELREIQKQNYFAKNLVNQEFKNQLFNDKNHYELNQIYIDTTFKNDKINIKVDGFYFVENKILPILISPLEKVTKIDRLTIALQSHFIQGEFKLKIDSAKIVFGKQLKETKLKLPTFQKEIRQILSSIKKIENAVHSPAFYKNTHCQVCEFSKDCLEKLRERDDLSLLGNLKEKEIEQKNNRGVFSVKQLSYTFRPKKNPYRKRKFLPELKALAIREQKTFIQEIPNLTQPRVEIFMDIEGVPDRNFYYLIGVVVKEGEKICEYSFWADTIEKQQDIFIQMLDSFRGLNDFVVYHYGAYEIQALKQIAKNISKSYQDKLNFIISHSVNILNFISNDVYTPTYTNGLKDIAFHLGFVWSDEKASGLQSIFWRYKWELTNDSEFKSKLLKYNIEDCNALLRIKNWLQSLSGSGDKEVLTNSLKQQNIFKWGVTVFAIDHFNEINAKAYFDYQREHIFLRTEKKVYRAITKKKEASKRYNKVDKKVNLFPENCEKCKSVNIKKIRSSKKTQIDLVFMKQGIKKQVTEYEGGAYRCLGCQSNFMVENMQTLPQYGYNLMLWSVNQKIQYKLSSESIINLLKDSFKISVSNTQMTRFKEIVAKKYITTFKDIIKNMEHSNLIHTDETIARIKGIDGYVWVFANYDSVYYEFRETREPEFLKELLKDFNGVLVSDFYTGYDSLECDQQKCLVHLIRDLNEDFLKNQLDEEFKNIVTEFGNLLRKIIETIDKYGLKQIHLNKHIKDVEKFYSKVVAKEFESELAFSYKKRLIKYREKLFLFLKFDGIPWNNNNAEHAIKPFAKWRKKISKSLTPQNIENHLILLSILETCKYQGINFYDFLISGASSIYNFSEK